MAKLQFTREATIYNKGLRLKVEVEFYKTVAIVFIIDDAKAFPCVDTFKVKADEVGFDYFGDIVDMARLRAIEKRIFQTSLIGRIQILAEGRTLDKTIDQAFRLAYGK